jgi:hypothetical protein
LAVQLEQVELAMVLCGGQVELVPRVGNRQLDEAMAGGGDPMHLAAVFGILELTAMHYAAAARALLATKLESSSTVDLRPGQ